ncbi:type I restriction-modification system subunit M N-terminal domain-containing protein [Candidatus Stoquefichus sp. SB1]|uniref:type I restriction-modification system subunit M N-terminal domain-containing protein n=1 Tax=Candidatus Stoquefichus sp. SB1 TaxID=1658109 RepID=UPI00067F53C8|nr:type I restriction-modification system subunit M N-terminal domain-containing protein [Candidatus Stoquefichus sp. SB1]
MVEAHGNKGYNIFRLLWEKTEVLLTEMDRNEIRDFLMGLLFYKYLSDTVICYVGNYFEMPINNLEEIQKTYEENFKNNDVAKVLIADMKKELSFYIEPDLTFIYFVKNLNSSNFALIKLLCGLKKIKIE